jgi:hypothetical protein
MIFSKVVFLEKYPSDQRHLKKKTKKRGPKDLAADIAAEEKKDCLVTLQELSSINYIAYGALSRVLNRMLGLAKKSIHNHTHIAAVVEKLFAARSISAFSHHSHSPGLAPSDFFLSLKGKT